MLKLYVGILIALIWALFIVKSAGSEQIPICYQNLTPSPELSVRERVLRMVELAGFDPMVADRIINCESGWNPKAIGDGGESWGLWQIHQPAHKLGSDSFDPYLSTAYAIKLMQSSRSYSHWTCYKRFSL